MQELFFWIALWVTDATTEEKMDLLSLPPSLSFPMIWKEIPAAGWEFLLVPLLPGFPMTTEKWEDLENTTLKGEMWKEEFLLLVSK